MKRILEKLFCRPDRNLFFYHTVVLFCFFWLCGLLKLGFLVCLLAFLLGQVFLLVMDVLYQLLKAAGRMVLGVVPHAKHPDS